MRNKLFTGGKRLFVYLSVVSIILTSATAAVTGSIASAQSPGDYTADATWNKAGSGSKEDPYLISTAEQLYSVVTAGPATTKNNYFLLQNDISLNDTAADNWYDNGGNKQWAVFKDDSKVFEGIFDGGGYTVYGLYYNQSGTNGDCYGLFPKAWNGAAIRNLKIDRADIKVTGTSGDIYAGALIGFIGKGDLTISKCYIGQSVSVNAKYAGGFIGGMGTGSSNTVSIGSCAFVGKVTEKVERHGGFAGNNWSGILGVTDSFTTASSGAFLAWNGKGTAVNSYSAGKGTGDLTGISVVSAVGGMKGDSAKINMPVLDWLNTWAIAQDSYPQLIQKKPLVNGIWNGTADSSWMSSGLGTKADPYLIETAEQFFSCVTAGTGSTNQKYFRLVNDLDLNDTASENWYESDNNRQWAVVTDSKLVFSGIFDGNGHTIKGLYYNTAGSNGSYSGLFPRISGDAQIRNLNVDFAFVRLTRTSGDVYAGALTGFTDSGNLSVIKCRIGDRVMIDAKYCGGFIGGMGGGAVNVTSSCFVGKVNETVERHGGFAGNVWSGKLTVTDSFATVSAGAFLAWLGTGTATDSYTTGKGGYDLVGINTLSSRDEIIGENAKNTMPRLDWVNVWTVGQDSYPQLLVRPVWNGSGDDGWTATGQGTEESPYLITSAEQLYSIVTQGEKATSGKYFKLQNDLYLNDAEDDEWYLDSQLLSWANSVSSKSSCKFAGVFDGDGHSVYGLYANKAGASGECYGLFPRASGNAIIKNIILEKSYLNLTAKSGDIYAGTLVGLAEAGTVTINKCYIGTVAYVRAKYAGGIIGGNSGADVTMQSSAFLGKIADGIERSGGFAGNVWAGTLNVTDSFTTASAGAFITWSGSSGSAESTYAAGKGGYDLSGIATASAMKGKTVQYEALSALKWGEIWKTTASYPEFITEKDVLGDIGGIWSGNAATWIEGAGTNKYPYIIDTPERLYAAVSKPEKNAKYLITEDIRLNDTSDANWFEGENLNEWLEGGSTLFRASIDSGKADGTLARISGLYRKNVTGRCALLPTLGAGASVRNLRITDSYLSGVYNSKGNQSDGSIIAGITGCVDANNVIVEGCIVEKSVILDTAWRAAGIAACVAGSVNISNCAFTGTLRGDFGVSGGIVADSWGTAHIAYSYTVGSFVANKYDVDNSRITACYSDTDQYDAITGSYHSDNVATLKISQITGMDALRFMPMLSTDIWSATEGSYPDILKRIEYYDGKEGEIWSGKTARTYASGSGTKTDPYIIKTAEQLYKMIMDNADACYYRLEADIKLNDTDAKEWYANSYLNYWGTNVGTGFKGSFDGNYHVVSGLYYDNLGSGVNVSMALFPYVAGGATIQKVGVTDSYISLTGGQWNYAAAIVGRVIKHSAGSAPKISECFGDSSVILDATVAGGIVAQAGSAATVMVENCFFVGSLTKSKNNTAALIGSLDGAGSTIKNCFGSTQENSRFVGGSYGTGRVTNSDKLIVDCYYYGSYSAPGLELIPYRERVGKNVDRVMPKLDFKNIWMTVKDGTPVLKGFENAQNYSDTGIRTTTITFVTEANDIVIEPIIAEIESVLSLPTPSRLGYIFDGWYVYPEHQIKFEDKIMPICDMTLYAKWTLDSIIQDFEDYPNTKYDLDTDYQYFRPGASGYTAKLTHGGYKSMHRIGKSDKEQDFLLNYRDPLTVGLKYTMYFWVCTDQSNAAFDISLVHNTWPDIAEPIAGSEKVIQISSLDSGKWKQYCYTFTAKTEWVSIRTSGSTSIYFDDFMLLTSDKVKQPGIFLPSTGEHAVLLLSIMVLFSISAVLFVMLKRSCRFKKYN